MAPRAVRDGVMMRTVSSPARVPATSFQCSESTAAARGCAPPGGVFSTSIFCAGRISSKNSFRARASAGTGGAFVGFGGGERLVAVDGLDQAQLAQVARERGLRDAHAQVDELAAQIVLTGDCFAREELQDLALPEFFMSAHVCLCTFMHNTA